MCRQPGSSRTLYNLNLYADDMLLYRPVRRAQEFSEWYCSCCWHCGISLLEPTCTIKTQFKSDNRNDILLMPTFDNTPMEMVEYLGVIISSDLSWSPRIQGVACRCIITLDLIYRKYDKCSQANTMLKLHLAFVILGQLFFWYVSFVGTVQAKGDWIAKSATFCLIKWSPLRGFSSWIANPKTSQELC